MSYLTLYYCQLAHVKPVAFTIIVLWTAILFTTIGVAASEFFCINLSTISTILGLSESMAGVTFLAFGNGSPDVFSTFAAIKSHSGSLAVGELIGAAGFITAVVAGSMALVKDFAVPKKSFLRDVGVFIVAIGFSMSFLANGKLDLWECVVMVGFYIFYVLLVIVWHWRLGRIRRKREHEALSRGHYVQAENEEEIDFEEEYRDNDDGSVQTRPHHLRRISTEDFNDLERADHGFAAFPDLDDDVERHRWMGELSSNMRVRKPRPGERHSSIYTPIRPSLVGALEFQANLSSFRKSQTDLSAPINLRRYSDDPSYLVPDQRKNGSSISDPEMTIGDSERGGETGAQIHGGPALPSSLGGRGRAVSANAADLLNSDPRNNSRPKDQERKSKQAPPTFETLHDLGNEFPKQTEVSPALLSATPPTSTQSSREPSPPRRRSRASSTTHLAPPAQDRPASDNFGSTSLDAVRVENRHEMQGRPKLKITRAADHEPPLFASPSRISEVIRPSPYSSPRPPSLRLPPPSASDQSEFVNNLEGQWSGKQHRRWLFASSPALAAALRTLFPSLCGWYQKHLWEQLLSILLIPSFFLLTVTLPVVEPGKDDVIQQPGASGALTIPESVNKSSQHLPTGVGYRDSTAGVAVGIEQRHRRSIHPGDGTSVAPPGLPESTELTHVAVSSGGEWNRWLVLVQCFTAPYFIVLAVWANFNDADKHTLLWPSIYSLCASLVATVLLLTTTTPTRPSRWHFLLCFLGFAVSITWISSIANEVVGVLKAIGVICNMSDAILGLTIFAFGNSLGDLVADIQVARLGFPYMAFSACFGGPMLNILLGIGLSGIYIVLRRASEKHDKHPDQEYGLKPYHVDINITLLISAVALLTTLVGLLIVIPLNGWRMDRRIGIGLIVVWCIATTANVIVEVTGVTAFSGTRFDPWAFGYAVGT